MGRQLSFEWPHEVTFGEDSYYVSEANGTAYAMVTRPGDWPEGKLVLAGPQGSGKTHLARLFAARTGALILDAPALAGTEPLPETGDVVLEDADRLPRQAEEWVFHLHNSLAAAGGALLFTAAAPPTRWAVALPDLVSRLQAATVVKIGDPDDALLAAVLRKILRDRQLAYADGLIPWLVPRMTRSFAAARRTIDVLEAAALGRGKRLTINLAREVLQMDADDA
ncbi:hypothetical protein OG2516_02718 [Oceanicola granulosus HTCC2516]|uniref:Uncharacterized protein n=1 Tax=Oceanicola granulosus (strain ATCC BAA-861 / DSM 15982 / KCTC 12143 / HTCC2516) TaxID=314256 RepID=Q2CCM0_OCEGH|nr:DnaA/Hda family protein [Oceanicola granulosus]EAR50393.1 hypothetical protein OG2516_02718 [Oceanicola granulosus HTCC2516]